MSETQTIKAIRRAAKQRERADELRRTATDELRERCRQAQAEGVAISQIAREAGLSRQGVYDLLAGRRPS
jgi:DNA-binding IclR family transcriptional regulator